MDPLMDNPIEPSIFSSDEDTLLLEKEAVEQEQWIHQFNLPKNDLPLVDMSSYHITIPEDELKHKSILHNETTLPLSSSSSPMKPSLVTSSPSSSSSSFELSSSSVVSSLSPGTSPAKRTVTINNPSTILEIDEYTESYSIIEDHNLSSPNSILPSRYNSEEYGSRTTEDASSSSASSSSIVQVPEAVPINYTEGFCRNYLDAQFLATWILHSIYFRKQPSSSSIGIVSNIGGGPNPHQLLTNTNISAGSLRVKNTIPTGLLSGSIHSVRGLHTLFPGNSSSISLSNRKFYVRICVLQSPQQMGEGTGGTSKSSSSTSAAHTVSFNQFVQVRPDIRVNPLTARRTPIFRTNSNPGDPVTGDITFQSTDNNHHSSTTDFSTNESKDEIQYSIDSDFICTLGSASNIGPTHGINDRTTSRRSSTISETEYNARSNFGNKVNQSTVSAVPNNTANRRGSIVQILPPSIPISAQLEWGYLNGYILLQLFEERDTRFIPYDPNATMVNENSSSSLTNILLGHSILRICDICAASTKPFNSTGSTLYNKIRSAHDDDLEDNSNHSVTTFTAQEFYLRLWVPLQNPKTSASFAETNGNLSPNAKARGNRFIAPAVDVSFSLVLPYDIMVPRQMLQSSVSNAEVSRPSTMTPRSGKRKSFRKPSSPRSSSPRTAASPGKNSSPYTQKPRPISVFTSESSKPYPPNDWNNANYDSSSDTRLDDKPLSSMQRPSTALPLSPVGKPMYHSYKDYSSDSPARQRISGTGKIRTKVELTDIPAAVYYAPTLVSNAALTTNLMHRNTTDPSGFARNTVESNRLLNDRYTRPSSAGPERNSGTSSVTPRKGPARNREETIPLSPQQAVSTKRGPLSPFAAPLPEPRMVPSSRSASHQRSNKQHAGIPSDNAIHAMASGPEAVANYVSELKHIVGLLENQVRKVKVNVDKKVGHVRREKEIHPEQQSSHSSMNNNTTIEEDNRWSTDHSSDYTTTALQFLSSTGSNHPPVVQSGIVEHSHGSAEWRKQVTSLQKQLQNLLDTE